MSLANIYSAFDKHLESPASRACSLFAALLAAVNESMPVIVGDPFLLPMPVLLHLDLGCILAVVPERHRVAAPFPSGAARES